MPMLEIKCPATGKSVATGISIDASSYPTTELAGNTVKCPACGKVHTWSKADVTNPPA